jgi:hypothetical protein
VARIIALLALLALVLAPAPGHATRMYQWVDPDTGTPYLSGTPPAWYRTGAEGPRVVVWEEGRLVDDTAREASRAERVALREAAEAAAAARERAEAEAREARRERLLARDPEAEEAPAEASEEGAEPLTEEEAAARTAEARELLSRYLRGVLDSALRQGIEELTRPPDASGESGADSAAP